MWGSCLQRLPSQAEYEIALLQSDSSITCCLKLPFAAEEFLKTHSKVQSSKSCGDFREVLFLLFQKREKSKSEGFFNPFLLSPCFPTLPQPALSPPFPSPCWTRENQSFLKLSVHASFYWRIPYLLFALNSKSNYNFSNQFIGRGSRRG